MTMARMRVDFRSCSISISNSAGELGSSLCTWTPRGCKASNLTGLASSILSVAYAGSLGLNSAQARNILRSLCEGGTFMISSFRTVVKKAYAIVVT